MAELQDLPAQAKGLQGIKVLLPVSKLVAVVCCRGLPESEQSFEADLRIVQLGEWGALKVTGG